MKKGGVIFAIVLSLVLLLALAAPAAADGPVCPVCGCPCSCCIESVNPHGQTIPPAGFTTAPGINPNSGRNPDGFYKLTACCPTLKVYASYVGSTNLKLFGPFSSGIVVKFTEAPGAKPQQKKIGSTNGQAGAVSYHFILPNDALISVFDNGTLISSTVCYVPPPPK